MIEATSSTASFKPEKPWDIDPMIQPDPQTVKPYKLLEPASSDTQKVDKFYKHGPVFGLVVRRIEVIYNPMIRRMFSLRLGLLKQQPKTAPNEKERQKVLKSLKDKARFYDDKDYPNVTFLPLWLGIHSKLLLLSICKAGFANFVKTNAGFFGKGLCFAYEPGYARRLCSTNTLLLTWVAVHSVYPVIKGDMPKIANRRIYDAHFIPVTRKNSKYHELVVFDWTQCLPMYVVHIGPKRLPAIKNPRTSEEEFTVGEKHYDQCQYQKALECFLRAAHANYPPAFYRLGKMYGKGGYLGPRNLKKSTFYYGKVTQSINWFKAHAQKDPRVQFYLGKCYWLGLGVPKDPELAFKCYQHASKKEHLEAIVASGMCWLRGKGVSKNLKEALRCFKHAAKKNYALGHFRLGYYYDTSNEYVYYTKEAEKYYRKAIVQGFLLAHYHQGLLYEGEGKYRKAALCYVKITQLHHPDTLYRLGFIYYFKKEVQNIGDKGTYDCFRISEEQGHEYARHFLARCLYYGRGVVEDKQKALKLFQQCLKAQNKKVQNASKVFIGTDYYRKQNYKLAIESFNSTYENVAIKAYYLGLCYFYGHGVKQSYTTAITKLKTVADGEDVECKYYSADAYYHLGLCYFKQQKFYQTKPLKDAIIHMRSAAKLGHKKATAWLKKWNIKVAD